MQNQNEYKWETLKFPQREVVRPFKQKLKGEMIFLDSGNQVWYFYASESETKPSLKFGYSVFTKTRNDSRTIK